MKKESNKAIVVVSFGSSYQETVDKTIAPCEEDIAAAFPEYTVIRAFTSNIIRKKLKSRGISVFSVEEALEYCLDQGVDEVVLQPLHIIPGEEYNEKILNVAYNYHKSFKRLKVSIPLLSSPEDYDKVAAAVKDSVGELNEGEAFVFMGHGTHHPAHKCYPLLEERLQKMDSRIYVGTVEFAPLIEDVMLTLKKNGVKKVTLMPFMMVAGDHAQNDMAGEEDDSWKSQLLAAGYEVEIKLTGLGEIKAIRDIYIEHLRESL